MTVVFQRVNCSQVFNASALLYLMVAVNWLGSTFIVCSFVVLSCIAMSTFTSLMIFIILMKFTPLHIFLILSEAG